MESRVIGVESLCLEGLVDYSIQAEDIIIYLCSFQGTFACFFANFAVFWCPDAGTSERTRLGEGSREFVLEGHRVSCLVPTSGGSGRGVRFGVFGANISLG